MAFFCPRRSVGGRERNPACAAIEGMRLRSAGGIKVLLACALWTQFVDAQVQVPFVAAESEAADMVS